MNRSLEQTLFSLLPTHNSALPQPLTDLASSLLAQSRHRASTLKAEEEIARLYACAHIACDRLKTTLDLPPIEPRPPIPPRIYKRLYTHLDHILPAGSSTPGRIRTPSAKLRAAAGTGTPLGISPLVNKTRLTPGKEKSLAQFRGSAPGTPSKSGRTPSSSRVAGTGAAGTDPFPPWIRPTLRFLCAELQTPRLGPVVVSGLESIALPHGRRSDDEWVWENLVPLMAALYLYVWNALTSRGNTAPVELAKMRKDVVRTMQRGREEVVIKGKGGEEVLWEAWKEPRVKDLDTAAAKIHRNGWLQMGWAGAIDDLLTVDRERESDGEEEVGDENGLDMIWRKDSMLQERFDYLSEWRRKEYASWKANMLKRIKSLERGPSQKGRDEDAMDMNDD